MHASKEGGSPPIVTYKSLGTKQADQLLRRSQEGSKAAQPVPTHFGSSRLVALMWHRVVPG